ncbi:Uma2 family endonuclease [Paludisphaera soli]|uniref:Uma2 family endonuclease n=1 Tax=Paludisphaera soli TaxID=2712865 RepID=UPI0013EA5F95|nr:Uma2 family endonuclease [Paludisphaera soli]
MSTVSPTAHSSQLPSAEEIFRIPIDLYEKMVELGGLDGDDRIELLNGVLVRKMTKSPPHHTCTELCRDELEKLAPKGFKIRSEGPIRLPKYSEPEPDLAIVRGGIRDYTGRHPQPSDVVLIVEVADSSLARDRGEKRDLYAGAGIPAYWVVDLAGRRVEVYGEPRDGRYTATSVVADDGAIDLIVDGAAWGRLDVAAILP